MTPKPTLTLKKPSFEIAPEEGATDSPLLTVSAAQMADMIKTAVEAALEAKAKEPYPVDPTLDLPTGDIPRGLIADKANLPPPEQRSASFVQPPPRLWGKHLHPSPVAASAAPIGPDVDPRTGSPFSQVMPQASTQISPPPTRHFR